MENYNTSYRSQLRSIRKWILFFMLALIISGATALSPQNLIKPFLTILEANQSFVLFRFALTTSKALTEVDTTYPSLLYGYDWLAFAHIIIAILFIGPLKEPVKNKWIIEFGMLACLLVIPFAFIAGTIRNIPWQWGIVDCSFGLIGLLPLTIIERKIKVLERRMSEKIYHANATR